ncbi:hypothetical protein CVT25_003136 [Psilocybe cyanescens]|uniref:Uncharacterized protein n=1 Tax=Psilocybe cyanescens TaxID=93625 RepID=A0A409XQW6_PSICY|nr:hypothetical protein CVT25_003136 [Psilocybe cyanescens]
MSDLGMDKSPPQHPPPHPPPLPPKLQKHQQGPFYILIQGLQAILSYITGFILIQKATNDNLNLTTQTF